MLFSLAWLCSGLIVASLSDVVHAQSFDVPTNWQGTSTSLNRTSRELLARGAADALLPYIDSSGTVGGFNGFLAASFISVLSLQDYLSGNITYKQTVETNVQIYGQQNPNYFYLDPKVYSDPIYWGLASFYAYRAYRDDFLLNTAESLWNLTSAAFITADDASTFKQASRNVTIKPACDAPSIAGGVFWDDEIQNTTIVNGETIGPWLTLSAYLYEATGSQQYLTAAQESADFMQFHMLKPGGYVYDSYDVAKCAADNGTVTYNSGWFVEGLSVLANVTQNSTQAQLLYDLVPGVVTQTAWTLVTGVNSELIGPVDSSAGALKGTLIRGLTEMKSRFTNQTQLANLIEAYIAVQFNSILSNARAGTSNNYTAKWTGPAPPDFQAPGNVVALDVFNSMFSFVPPVEPNTTSSTDPANTASPVATGRSTSHTGAIVGGVVGGVGGVAVLAGLLFLLYRRRHSKSSPRDLAAEKPTDTTGLRNTHLDIQPFMGHHAVVGTPVSESSYASGNGMAKPGRFVEVISDDGHLHPTASAPSTERTAASSSAAGPARSDSFVHIEPTGTATADEIPTLLARLNHLLRRQEAPSDELPPPAYGA
ncbi:hypothetical protein PENSPDRAFT_620058 [Peniophora sp. CONT]|nr:hypothetical protein PENSPDRAFT_620058 [Peniophora sp. CONT]